MIEIIFYSIYLALGLIFFFKEILPFEENTPIVVYLIFIVLSLTFGWIPLFIGLLESLIKKCTKTKKI